MRVILKPEIGTALRGCFWDPTKFNSIHAAYAVFNPGGKLGKDEVFKHNPVWSRSTFSPHCFFLLFF